MKSRNRPLLRWNLAVLIFAVVATSIAGAAPLQGTTGPGSADTGSSPGRISTSLGKQFTPGFGFMVLFSARGDGPNLDDFKRDIDVVAENGQKWVRMGIVGWEVMGVWHRDRQIVWNEAALQQYDLAIDYAKSKGLAIHLITADADNNPATSFTDYQVSLKEYWQTLARRYANKVDVWQVYNESDTGHFRLLSQPIKGLSGDYLSDLGTMLAIARTAIKAVNPDVMLTTTSTGWPMSDKRQENWQQYFDGISQHLDVISLNVYPADNFAEIDMLPKRINDVKTRYGKPVIIAEVGLQVAGKWTADDQRLYVTAAIEAAKRAQPMAIIVYQLRDEGSNAFGLLKENRTPRPSFKAVTQVMKY